MRSVKPLSKHADLHRELLATLELMRTAADEVGSGVESRDYGPIERALQKFDDAEQQLKALSDRLPRQ